MKTTLMAVTAIAMASGVMGCATQSETPETASAELGKSSVGAHIARLNALQVVEVSALGGSVPESGNCYHTETTSIGMVCAQDMAALADKIAEGDRRLDAFVVAAEAAVAAHGGEKADVPEVAQDLATLRSLNIVDVDRFILDEAETSNCYSLFCEESDRLRAGKLHAIAQATKNL